jgi:hypothetical protein
MSAQKNFEKIMLLVITLVLIGVTLWLLGLIGWPL